MSRAGRHHRYVIGRARKVSQQFQIHKFKTLRAEHDVLDLLFYLSRDIIRAVQARRKHMT